MLKGLKSYQPSKYKCSDFLSKTHVTFLLWLITFEPLEQKQIYIPLLKVLMCGMNAWGAQWHGGIFILQFTSLKMVLLLHKTTLVNFPLATTVAKATRRLKTSEIKENCEFFVYSMYGCMGANFVCHCSLKSYRLWALRRIYRRGGVVKCGGTRILQGSLTYDFTKYSWILTKKYWTFFFCQKLIPVPKTPTLRWKRFKVLM